MDNYKDYKHKLYLNILLIQRESKKIYTYMYNINTLRRT